MSINKRVIDELLLEFRTPVMTGAEPLSRELSQCNAPTSADAVP